MTQRILLEGCHLGKWHSRLFIQMQHASIHHNQVLQNWMLFSLFVPTNVPIFSFVPTNISNQSPIMFAPNHIPNQKHSAVCMGGRRITRQNSACRVVQQSWSYTQALKLQQLRPAERTPLLSWYPCVSWEDIYAAVRNTHHRRPYIQLWRMLLHRKRTQQCCRMLKGTTPSVFPPHSKCWNAFSNRCHHNGSEILHAAHLSKCKELLSLDVLLGNF